MKKWKGNMSTAKTLKIFFFFICNRGKKWSFGLLNKTQWNI